MIEEVRCKYALEQEQQSRPITAKQQTFEPQAPFTDNSERIESVIESAYLGKMFDFYTKELARLREEKKIMAMVMLTERVRKQKESYETGMFYSFAYNSRT